MYFSPEVGTKEFSKFIVCFNDTSGACWYINSDVTVYLFWCKKEILKFNKGDKSAKYKQVAIRDIDGWKAPKNEIFAELTLLDSGSFFKVFE